MAVHRHRETQFDPHKFWFVGFHQIGVAQTYWYPNCFPFLSNVRSQRTFHVVHWRKVHRLHPCSPFLSIQTQDSSEGFDPPFGCRSCTPRPRCALSCAQVMMRAVIRSVKTMSISALQPRNLSNVVSLDKNSFRCRDQPSHEHISRFILRQDKQQAERLLSKFLSACKKEFCRFV